MKIWKTLLLSIMKTIDMLYLRRILASTLKNSYLLNSLYNICYKLLNRRKFLKIIKQRKKLSIFQYKELAAPIPYYPIEFVKDSNFYGQSYAIKEYACMRKLEYAIEHGLYYDDYIPYASFCRTIRKIITFSTHRKRVIQSRLNKPVVAIGPYIHYASPFLSATEIADIKKKYGKILLFFPSHSCVEGMQPYDVEKTIAELKAICLKGGFQTVFVNMYYYDILHMDYVKYYLNAGFKVVTAGHRLDIYFLSRLKSIIELSDYTVSNSIGTHLGYCIWMNKPHYIINNIDLSLEDYKKIGSFFMTYHEVIQPEQYAIVSEYWGFECVRTPAELKSILK